MLVWVRVFPEKAKMQKAWKSKISANRTINVKTSGFKFYAEFSVMFFQFLFEEKFLLWLHFERTYPFLHSFLNKFI